MFAKTTTLTFHQFVGQQVVVETDINNGLPTFQIVGLPTLSVKEARQRVRSALKNSGCRFPLQRLTVNLAPAALSKNGTHFDLAIAVGVLQASQQIPIQPSSRLFFGELSLTGELRAAKGVVAAILEAEHNNFTEFITGPLSRSDAAILSDLSIGVVSINSLTELLRFLKDGKLNSSLPHTEELSPASAEVSDSYFNHIAGQHQAKRALEIAAAGGHNILFVGPPGVGKTMLARSLPQLLPPLSKSEQHDLSYIYSLAGLPIPQRSPLRTPHHTISRSKIIGGRQSVIGEVALAAYGVLFFDELLEFESDVLESLRQSLEPCSASPTEKLSRHFIFVAATNPCPCGFYLSKEKSCSCSSSEIQRYQRRLSGPMLDRIDLQLHLTRSNDPLTSTLLSPDNSDQFETVRSRVVKARESQNQRLSSHGLRLNDQMSAEHIHRYCRLSSSTQKFLDQVDRQYHFSYRGLAKILKIARTIADLDGSPSIQQSHLAEALQYRFRQGLQ